MRTVYNNDWIERNIGRFDSFVDIATEYNAVFNTDIKHKAFKLHCNRIGFVLGRFVYTEEQEEWLKKNYPLNGATKSTELFNKKFGTTQSVECIKAHCNRKGLVCTKETKAKIQKNVTSNLINHNNTVSANIGTVGRYSNGYAYIKTEKGWERYNKYVWEQAHGKMPKGHSIVFLDGNIENHNLDNLVCVPNKYIALINHNLALKSNNPDLKKASIEWCKLYFAIGGKETLKKYFKEEYIK